MFSRSLSNLRFSIPLSLFLIAQSTSAAITFTFDNKDFTIPEEGGGMNGPVATPHNTTGLKWEVMGWRFYSDLAWTKLTGDQDGKSSVTETPNGFLHEATFTRPDLYLLPPKGNDAMGMSYNWEQFAQGGNGNPHSASTLVKLYDKGVMPLPLDTMLAIEPSAVTSYVNSFSTYYDTEYRYLDTLGMRGGSHSGGFYDTWNGETQIQMAIPADTFDLSSTPVWLAPETSDGPMYWMSLAMLQEYFSGDMQFQMTIGFKETMAGLASVTDPIPYHSKNVNNDGAFGPFEVESFTYVTGSMYYPQFFPKYTEALSDAASEFNFGEEAINVKEFTSEYCGPLSGTFLKDATIIGCMMGSHHTFRRIFDLLANDRRMCFKEFLEEGVDGYFIRATLGVMYNRGITAPGVNTFGNTSLVDSVLDISKYKEYLDDPDANEYIPMGNSEYRHHLLENFLRLEEYSKMAVADKSVPIYDEWITEDDLKRFFFGDGGSVATQGAGGLGAHFTIKDRQKMWDDLIEGFNTLSANWNESEKVISYRYDWLTLLRVVKNHFPVVYKPRPAFGEAANWMDKRDLNEGDVGCDGSIIDKTFPHATLTGASTNNDEFIAQFNFTDNQAVKELIWTKESKWNTWSQGTQKSGDQFAGIWELRIPSSEINTNDTLWVGVVDSSGNAEIKTVIVQEFGEVAIEKPVSKITAGMTISFAGEQVTLDRITDGEVSIKLYDLRGRELYNFTTKANFGVARFTLPSIAKGSYVMSIESPKQQRSIQIIK